MANIWTNAQMWLEGLLTAHASSTENVTEQIYSMREFDIDYSKAAADAMASTATAADYFYVARRDVQLINVDLVSAGTLATDPTDFATLIVNKHDGAGGAATVAASVATSTGSVAAGVPYALTLSTTLANIQLTAGQVLSWQVTKGGAGKVVPVSNVRIRARYI